MEEGIYDDVSSVELSEMDRGARVEKTVEIYMSADAVRAQETNTQRKTTTQQTGRVTLSAQTLSVFTMKTSSKSFPFEFRFLSVFLPHTLRKS